MCRALKSCLSDEEAKRTQALADDREIMQSGRRQGLYAGGLRPLEAQTDYRVGAGVVRHRGVCVEDALAECAVHARDPERQRPFCGRRQAVLGAKGRHRRPRKDTHQGRRYLSAKHAAVGNDHEGC